MSNTLAAALWMYVARPLPSKLYPPVSVLHQSTVHALCCDMQLPRALQQSLSHALAVILGHGTYKGDPNCPSMDCVDLVLVLGLGLGLVLYCKIWRPLALLYMCPLPLFCSKCAFCIV